MIDKKYHFIGIGGIGMSALAKILLERKAVVSGSDTKDTEITRKLISMGATIYNEQLSSNIEKDLTVVYSTAIKKDNVEYKEALMQNCKMQHRSELLRDLTEHYKPLVVAGTHGKTTTSSLVAAALINAGCDPSFAIGGILNEFKTNGVSGSGDYFVVEGDESDGSFANYQPHASIITNIEAEHMDHYENEDNLLEAFYCFAMSVKDKNRLFWCAENWPLEQLYLPGVSYGFDIYAKLRGSNLRERSDRVVFDADFEGVHYRDINVALLGRHNALNALAAFGLCISLGLPEWAIRDAFQFFRGIDRRCTRKSEIKGILILDDYAHHPTAIAMTLKGIKRSIKNRRLVAVFQPHRYTRTQTCLKDFANAFDSANALFITDIYSAGEKPIDGISPNAILKQIRNSKASFFL